MGLLIDKAEHGQREMSKISLRQRRLIDENIMRNADEFSESEQFRAMTADAEMFGLDAILWKDES